MTSRLSGRPALLAAAALLPVLALTACGGTSTGSTSASPSGTESSASDSPAGGVSCQQAEITDGSVTVDGVVLGDAEGPVPTLTITDDAQPVTELVCYDVIVGDGATVVAGDTVTFNYEGAGFTTKQVFDSSYARGEALQFPLTNLIPGWQQGIPGMQVGGRRLLIIPGDLAYGAAGNPPAIAENETLAFVIDVVSIP